MNRQLTPDELDELYRGVGRCIWHLQYLEDVLHTFLAMKVEIQKPGRVSPEVAFELLAKQRRANLGTALGVADRHNALPAGLMTKLRALKEERDWLVHRSMHQDGDSLYTDKGRRHVLGRLEAMMEETLTLKALLMAEVEVFLSSLGQPLEEARKLATIQVRRLRGEA